MPTDTQDTQQYLQKVSDATQEMVDELRHYRGLMLSIMPNDPRKHADRLLAFNVGEIEIAQRHMRKLAMLMVAYGYQGACDIVREYIDQSEKNDDQPGIEVAGNVLECIVQQATPLWISAVKEQESGTTCH